MKIRWYKEPCQWIEALEKNNLELKTKFKLVKREFKDNTHGFEIQDSVHFHFHLRRRIYSLEMEIEELTNFNVAKDVRCQRRDSWNKW